MPKDQSQAELLRDEIRGVREEILTLVVRMEDIVLQQIPQILANHALKVGCWEQALLEAELEARRAKRRLALAQAQANRGEAPDISAIDARLDTELAAWEDRVGMARDRYEQALAYLTSMAPMARVDATKLKSVYRTLVKRLHPDVSPKGTLDGTDRASLFALAQAAYRNGDLGALQSMEVATRHLDPTSDDLESTDDETLLGQELEIARIEEGLTRERLAELEEGEVMRLGRLLDDPEWLTGRTTELREATERWEAVRRECDDRLKGLMEGADGNQ